MSPNEQDYDPINFAIRTLGALCLTSDEPACLRRAGDFGWLLLMAEGRRSPLDGLLPWALPGDEVALAELRFAEQIGVRVRPPVAAYLASGYGEEISSANLSWHRWKTDSL